MEVNEWRRRTTAAGHRLLAKDVAFLVNMILQKEEVPMRWVKASDRMPTAADAVDGDVVVRWVHNCGTHCVAVVNVMDVNGHDEWLEGAFADIPSPNGRGNHSVGPDYSTLGGADQ